jgi:hypothetical protein
MLRNLPSQILSVRQLQNSNQEIMVREALLAAVFRERDLKVTDVGRDSFKKLC